MPNLVLVLLLFLPLSTSASEPCDAVATLMETEGEVRVTRADSPFPENDPALPYSLCPGDQVQTVSDAGALIRHPDGDMVMAADSRLAIVENDEVQVESGAVLFQVEARTGERLKSGSPSVVIGVKGTRFLVSSGPSREDIALFDGRVDVERRDGREMAYYRAPSRDEMTFEEYREQQRGAFRDYVDTINQDFAEYREQLMARFEAYVDDVELKPGRQLTLGDEDDEPRAVEAPVDNAFTDLHDQLASWLER